MTLTQGGNSSVCHIPKRRWDDSTNYPVRALAIAPERSRVQLFLGNRYYEWNLQSRDLERDSRIPIIFNAFNDALSRDSETLIEAGGDAIVTFSTRTGRTLTYLPKSPNAKLPLVSTSKISPFGSYIISGNYRVAETRTGRILWKFNPQEVARSAEILFSPDESLTALPLGKKGFWEIHETKTGRLLGTLPLVPNATGGAFSPDNSTLYSIANGVLYCQRAR